MRPAQKVRRCRTFWGSEVKLPDSHHVLVQNGTGFKRGQIWFISAMRNPRQCRGNGLRNTAGRHCQTQVCIAAKGDKILEIHKAAPIFMGPAWLRIVANLPSLKPGLNTGFLVPRTSINAFLGFFMAGTPSSQGGRPLWQQAFRLRRQAAAAVWHIVQPVGGYGR